MTNRPMRVALPSKGRLSERALELFELAGLHPAFAADRALVASLGDDFQAIFVRAQDIPEYVADGAAEIGVTGADCVAESGRDVTELLDLGFGRCRLVVAAREESTVTSASELPAGHPGRHVVSALRHRLLQVARDPDLDRPGERRHRDRAAPRRCRRDRRPHLDRLDAPRERAARDRHGAGVHGAAHRQSARRSRTRRERPAHRRPRPPRSSRCCGLPRSGTSWPTCRGTKLDEVRDVIPGLSGPTIVEVLDSGSWVAAHAVVDADAGLPDDRAAQGARRAGHPRHPDREADAVSAVSLFARGRLADLDARHGRAAARPDAPGRSPARRVGRPSDRGRAGAG